MRQTINGADFRLMMISAAAAIDLHKQQINELNVFPVPDGDTGTNMSLTMGAAAAEFAKNDTVINIGKSAEIAAGALLRGARGNSGVILSLLFRGFAKHMKELDECDSFDFALALGEGVDAAYKAVMKPTEGTILTVSRVSAEHAAILAAEGVDMEVLLEKTIEVGYEALALTVEQNPVLKKAGVVDAGAKGYLIILEGMLAALRGEALAAPAVFTQTKDRANFADFDTEDITFGYCTEFIVARENEKDPMILMELCSELGDSLVLVDDEEIIKVHVHTDHPGTVLEEALTYGSLETVKIENMRYQHTEKVLNEDDRIAGTTRAIAEPEKRYGFVSVCAGEGISAIFGDLGVDGVIEGGQTMNPSTEDILIEIDKTPAEIVYVLPNNKNIIMAAEQCVHLAEGKQVVVLPTKTVPQGIASMLAFDENQEPDINTKTMVDAAKGIQTMQITYAARASEFDGHEIAEGDYIALYESSLFGTSTDIFALLEELAEEVRKTSSGFITIFYGDSVSEHDAQKAAEVFTECNPSAEVALLCGGQPVYYYLISAE